MSQEEPVVVFSLVVGPSDITVEKVRGRADFEPCEVKIDDLQRRTTQVLVTMLREGRLRDEEEFKVLGASLYRVLFNNPIGEAVRKAFDGPLPLIRVELEFGRGQEVLSSWPWEYLYCPSEHGKAGSGYFLAHQFKLVLTRRLRLDNYRSLRIEKPPLRVLFVASSPTGLNVEFEKIREVIKDLGPEMIRVTYLLPYEEKSDEIILKATWKNFVARIETEEFHAIHFLGHGKWDSAKKAGTILFMNSNDTEDPRSDDQVADVLMGRNSVRLVFLQACESALSDPYQAFSGVAQQLAQKGIPAVVGMQYKIQQGVANRFASAFYGALANKLTVDAAVQKARRTIVDNSSDTAQRLGFGLPVLYLRESDSLFATEGPVHGQDKILPSEFSPCPWCSARNTAIDNFCGECRGELICPSCGARVDRRRASCGKCDYTLYRSSVLAQSVLAPSKRSEFVNPEHEGQFVAQIIGREGSPKNRPS
jgi:hypothetical protein